MLAQTAENVSEALSTLGTAALEHKLDGARIQVHKSEDEVRIYSRQSNDVTQACPEIVERILAVSARSLVLDGEAIALDPEGRPHPFQTTMRRFGRKLEVGALRNALPLTSVYFDCLFLDDVDLTSRSASDRFRDPETRPSAKTQVVPRLVTSDSARAQSFVQDALDAGHEGVMAKSLDAPYEAGSRGKSWLKIKTAETLDLVVLAAEWGSGRRRGWLSNLHLGARDPSTGDFVMLGKTFKGMTDEILAWQTAEAPGDRDGEGRLGGARPAGAGGGDRVQRHPEEPSLSGRSRPSVREAQGLPRGQAPRRGGHHRDGPRDLPPAHRGIRSRSTEKQLELW